MAGYTLNEQYWDKTGNPYHRAILLNYLRHALLEVAGRWLEIRVPEMTIASPAYRISADGKTMYG